MVKTMTCNQLGGPCDTQFHAKTFEEMGEMSRKHVAETGDEVHVEAMKKMKGLMDDPNAMKEWMESKEKEFAALPEDI